MTVNYSRNNSLIYIYFDACTLIQDLVTCWVTWFSVWKCILLEISRGEVTSSWYSIISRRFFKNGSFDFKFNIKVLILIFQAPNIFWKFCVIFLCPVSKWHCMVVVTILYVYIYRNLIENNIFECYTTSTTRWENIFIRIKQNNQTSS